MIQKWPVIQEFLHYLMKVLIPMYAVAMCFVSYEDDVLDGYGADWIDCACGWRLHVDCGEDCVTDCRGNKRYCPYCKADSRGGAGWAMAPPTFLPYNFYI